jgi:hypothetical protein
MNKYFTLLGASLIIFLTILVFSTHNASATDNNVTTGDASSFSCAVNLVNTYTNYFSWFNDHCITPTPTITVTPTPTSTPDCDRDFDGSNPNGDDQCLTPTPSPIVTVTPTVTPTPTPVPSNNNGGGSDGKSDGRSDGRSSCPSCTQTPQGQVLGASTGPQVLGLSNTGGEENILLQFVQLFGALTFAGLGFTLFKKNG